METVILEIRDAEGGEDAKLLVNDMKNMYVKACKKNSFDVEITEEREGFVSI